MEHIRISGSEPSSLILSRPPKCQKSWSQKGWCNQPIKLQFQSILTREIWMLSSMLSSTLRLVLLLVCCLYKEVYLQMLKCVSFWLHGCCEEWEGWPVKRLTTPFGVTVATPTDRPKSVRNRCLIEHFCGVVCIVTLPFWHFCWCRGFVVGLSQISAFLSQNATNQPKSTIELGYMCPWGLTGPQQWHSPSSWNITGDLY